MTAARVMAAKQIGGAVIAAKRSAVTANAAKRIDGEGGEMKEGQL